MAEYKFEPFQKVLVRDDISREWVISLYNRYLEDKEFPHFCMTGGFRFCVPYDGNEYLLGTTLCAGPCWNPEPGELVAVSDNETNWYAQKFIHRTGELYTTIWYTGSQKEVHWKYCAPVHKHFKIPE